MRETQKSQTDFAAGVQAGLRTASVLLERLAVKSEQPEPTPPAPKPATSPRPPAKPR